MRRHFPGLLASLVFLTFCCVAQTAERAKADRPLDVAGNWQVSWQARLGTEQATVQLQQDGVQLSGTMQDVHGTSPLSGSIEGDKISFEVQFGGARPFTIGFTGKVDGDKISGTSQAKNVGSGQSGAYLGHGGEVVQPEHPWTATRQSNQSKASK